MPQSDYDNSQTRVRVSHYEQDIFSSHLVRTGAGRKSDSVGGL
jgi:hypothetical protein